MDDVFGQPQSNMPTVLIIFGATGDLMKKKLVPALFHLSKKGKLPDRFRIIGYARRPLSTEEFRRHIGTILRERDISDADCKEFLEIFSYVQGNFEVRDHYDLLANAMKAIDDVWGVCSSKLFYLAVSPNFYKTIFGHLSSSELTTPCSPEEGWTRVLVEKPFGTDADTAQKLDALLGRLFKEMQIYRIDHYLAKEMLQNILAFRFSNNLFEQHWSGDAIERIEIRLWERIGVEDRGTFYDGIGALRDVGQNHLLQMLALVTMELPESFTSSAIRKERQRILETLVPPAENQIATSSMRAQYGGYGAIPGVTQGSKTETYFKMQTTLSSPRWEGVPIILEAGKRMGKNVKEIVVTFRHSQPCLCPEDRHYKNKVYFTLEPEERITIRFWAKKPGIDIEMEERTFDFLLRDAQKKTQYVEEYEKLLSDCIIGDQMLFVSTGEVAEMWRFTDPFVHGWRKNVVPLKIYQPDTHDFTSVDDVDDEELTGDTVEKSIGFVGLGKMGKNMVARLKERHWDVHACDIHPAALKEATTMGAKTYSKLSTLIRALKPPRTIWLMVAPPTAVSEILFGEGGLASALDKGDTVIDGGNSFFNESVTRAKKLAKSGICFLDAGVSGGPEGARLGAVIFVGGDRETFTVHENIFRDLARPGGYGHMGDAGAGHFVKMVHNGIEYGMMESLAEGFSLLKKSRYKLNLSDIAYLYNNGSVIESRLVGWLKSAYKEYGEDLRAVKGTVGRTGEGEWMVKFARKRKVPTPVIRAAVDFRVKTEKHPNYTGKILSALRNRFGGHAVT